MKSKRLIADSGGTKTDWICLDGEKVLFRKSGPSLHPRCWNTVDWDLMISGFCSPYQPNELDFQFYGAGCSTPEAQNTLIAHLSKFPWVSLKVGSDTEVAVLATLDSPSNFVSILGTGTALIEKRNGRVATIIGGLGFDKGDEGGGAYFGKMIANKIKRDGLTKQQRSLLPEDLLKKIVEGSTLTIKQALEIDNLLAPFSDQFMNVHMENLETFVKFYLKPFISVGSTIDVVGGYGYYNQKLVAEVLHQSRYQLGKVVHRPLDAFIPKFRTK